MNFQKIHYSYKLQTFPFPDSVIYYLSKHPSSVKVYKKLIKTCKYFFATYPIIIVPCLHFPTPKDFSTFTCLDKKCFTDVIYSRNCHKIKFNKSHQRYWLSSSLCINAHTYSQFNIAKLLIPKLVNLNIKKLCIYNQNILFEELLQFSSYVKDLELHYNNISCKNKSIAQIESILEAFISITKLSYSFKVKTKEISSQSVSNLVKLGHLKNLESFEFGSIPQIFDFDTFADFMMNNQHIQFCLYFCNPISQAYIKRLQCFIRSLASTMFRGGFHPKIEYPVFYHE